MKIITLCKSLKFQKEIILVINKNNYMWESIKLKIEYVKKLGKKIMYYTDLIKEN